MSDYNEIDSRDSYSNRFQVKPRDSRNKVIHSYSSNKNGRNCLSDNYNNSYKSSHIVNSTRRKHSVKRVTIDGDINYKSDRTPNNVYKSKLDNIKNKENLNLNLNQNNNNNFKILNNICDVSDNNDVDNLENNNHKKLNSSVKKQTSGLDSLFSATSNIDSSSKNTEVLKKEVAIEKNNKLDNDLDISLQTTNSFKKISSNIDGNPSQTNKIKKINKKGSRINVKVKNMPQEKLELQSNNYYDVNGNVNRDNLINKPRKLLILKPTNYSVIEQISNAIKNNNAIVICLKFANEENSRRILDFSFGAASVTDYNVSLGSAKTYVFTKGYDLTKHEKLKCVKDGIVLKEN